MKSNKAMKKELHENGEINNLLLNNIDKFSVQALMMKQEDSPIASNYGMDYSSLNDVNQDASIAQLGLQQTFQNLKNLFVNYTLNNVSN